MVINRLRAADTESFHHAVFFILLCVLAVAMPTSRSGMSTAQILLGVNWLFEGRYREKTLRFWNNKPALIFSLIYLVHVAGLLWSQDLHYGILSDLKNKLPMLTLTFLVASSKPLTLRQIYIILLFFAASVLVTSFIGAVVFFTGSYVDFRHVSPFVPHVYFSMMILMTVFMLPWLSKRISSNRKWYLFSLLISAWLLVFLFLLQTITGFLCLAGILFFLLLRQVFKGKSILWSSVTALALLALIVGGALTVHYMYRNVNLEIACEEGDLEEFTALGNRYKHDLESDMHENGHPVFVYIAGNELSEAWNRRSEHDFSGYDKQGNQLRYTLYRYMTSMGLRKDAEGLQALSDEDVRAVERGIPNYLYTQWPGVMVRVHQVIWEIHRFNKTGDPSGHTFTQRLELWKGSGEAFREKPVFGWGTGDIYIAVKYGLNRIDSKMKNHHMKPHNQYLLFLLTLGIAGSLVIYFSYFLYIRKTRAYRFLPFNIFMAIMIVSMLGNNPVDAQTGQTFFSFFTLLFGIMMGRAENPDADHSRASQ